MTEFPHFILPRAQVDLDRRKRPGFGSRPNRDYQEQARKITKAVDEALITYEGLRSTIVNPALIVRVRTASVLPEDEWVRAGLVVLGHDENNSVVLFSSDAELTEFRARIAAYEKGAPEGRKNPQYDSLIAAIEEFAPLAPEDRIGSGLKNDGFKTPGAFQLTSAYRLDVELWEVGTHSQRTNQVNQLLAEIREHEGDITDRYIGTSFTALRVAGAGTTFRWLLTLPAVRMIDNPPQIDEDVEDILETTVGELGAIATPSTDAPGIAILDSGINEAHPVLAGLLVDKMSFPATLGSSDVRGHGTKVSGVAAYGDVRDCIERKKFSPSVRLFSGKVVNDRGNFDDLKLVPSQMDAAIRYFHSKGCRIFNLSLGDRNATYSGGKVGMWTNVLDELARELDVLIVVATGNYAYAPRPEKAEDHLIAYPNYLLEPQSRLLEPSVGANLLTVGAIAHAAMVPNHEPGTVSVRPIAKVGEPAPFTRCGPGIHDAIKPELCDEGGNVLFDGMVQGLSRYAESEIVTTHPRYLERLFTTAKGTSYAAPLVAHKAALVLRAFPRASANLLRALLVNSARPPEPSIRRLEHLGDVAIRKLCGYGIANVETASTSDTNRVVLYADDTIGLDRFYVYEVPVPRAFSETKGSRSIRVTLAFDPPTRHARSDYLGIEMSFRLVRGKTLAEVIDFYKKRKKEVDGDSPELEGKHDCSFDPKARIRECGTLQSAAFTMSRNPAPEYGETYYLVVRCERKWVPDDFLMQRFAIVVELQHEFDIQLYQHIRQRVQVRVPA